MQRMSELMEHRCHLIPCKQRGLTLGSLGIVAHIEDDGQLLALATLFLEAVHPCTATLGGTTEIIAIEKGFRLSILINNLKDPHVGMVCRDVGTLLECQSVNTIGSIEHTIDEHAIHIEIRLHLILRDIKQFLLHLGRIVEIVVGLQLEFGTLTLTGKILDGLCLGISLGHIGLNQVHQEVIDILGGLCHGLLKRVGSIVRITHDLSLFSAEFGNLHHDGEGVVLTCSISTMDRSLIDLLAQFTIVETGQRSLLCGVDDDNGIRCFLSSAFRILGTLGDISLTKSGQLLFTVNPHHCIIGSIG